VGQRDLLHAEINGSRLRLTGEVDLSSVGTLRQALEAAAAKSKGQVVVDLSGVRFMGAAGINEIDAFLRECPHTIVVVESPSPQVRRLLQLIPISGLHVSPADEAGD
jgi:anti-anti-sigma factor